MAEAEDVLTDVARHATVLVRDLWRRQRPLAKSAMFRLDQTTARLDLLITVAFGVSYPIRTAQVPVRPTFLDRTFGRKRWPWLKQALPATDGVSLWLPIDAAIADASAAAERYRVVALQQAMRASRGCATLSLPQANPVEAALYLLLEAQACDVGLIERLPGIREPLQRLRRDMLSARPPISAFSPGRRRLEELLRGILQSGLLQSPCESSVVLPLTQSPQASWRLARPLAAEIAPDAAAVRAMGADPLLKDWWTGELRAPSPPAAAADAAAPIETGRESESARSARLARRPEVREAKPDEDSENNSGAWMVQADQPHQHAEDPLGLQRPLDRDEETGAEQFGDMLSELPEARLVSTPARAPEVLLSDDPPPATMRRPVAARRDQTGRFRYPEWDYRTRGYQGAATVVQLRPLAGSQQWVDDTLARHGATLDAIRRRFEMLKAEPIRMRRRRDGEEIDIAAYIESYADFRAGQSRSDRVYQTSRPARRSIAVTLLVDISGSTDGWIAASQRVVDVEREALLLVCQALDALGEPYAVAAFSGNGPDAVTVHPVKEFDERYNNDTALRIAALEPQHYTRAGAAIRHVTAGLMLQPAAHRLLLMLSDGKPNDTDHYEGRYGVEDVRQAVMEARLQQVHPFCLTIDRQAPSYLPHMFGANQYGLLTEPAALPRLLLEWVRQLLAR